MKFLENLRTKIGYNMLCRNARKVSRNKTFNNLETALSVGILFDSTQQDSYLVAKSLVPDLKAKGKAVESLGIVLNNEMLGYYTPVDNMRFFSLEDKTFFCYPNDETVVQPFISKDFDILINLCPGENLFIDYVMGLSKAKFKVSPQLSSNDFADFILQFSKTEGLKADMILRMVREYLAGMGKKTK